MYRLLQLIKGTYPTKKCINYTLSNNQVLKYKRRLQHIIKTSTNAEHVRNAKVLYRNMPLEKIAVHNVTRLGTDTVIPFKERIRLCLYMKHNSYNVYCRIPFLDTPIGLVEEFNDKYTPIPARRLYMRTGEVIRILEDEDVQKDT